MPSKTTCPCCRYLLLALLLALPQLVVAIDLVVTNDAEFNAALNSAGAGDAILLAPGIYSGGKFASGLSNVTIRSQFAASQAVILGGNEGLHLTDVNNVTVQDIVFDGAAANGINIDDGGSFATPSTNVTLRGLTVRNVGAGGNNDGIKLSGVTGFHVDRVQVSNWGAGGSAIDMVGAHNGLIENSWFHHPTLSGGGSGVRPKGGSKNITIRANRLELPGGNGRPLQAGGSTGAAFFRFIDGDSGYEADNIIVEGNIVAGGVTGASYVNIDGGNFHHNAFVQPSSWIIRILNEAPGLVETQNGVFADNVVLFDNGIGSSFVNVGPNTQPATFTFARNTWFNVDNPAASTPNLPAAESGGIIGVDPVLDEDGVIPWDFAWGRWLVNANAAANSFEVTDPNAWLLALPGAGAAFDPLLADPLTGTWTLQPLAGPQLDLDAFSQVVLLAQPIPLPGGLVLLLPALLWLQRGKPRATAAQSA